MARTKLKVELPDGSTATRTTERTYTHAVVCLYQGIKYRTEEKLEPKWIVHGWNGSLELAQKSASACRGKTWYLKTRIVPVFRPATKV